MGTTAVRRRIVVHSDDILVINGMELDGAVMKEIVAPDKRVLWAFIRRGDDTQAVPYDETRCIWLQDEDLVRNTED